MFIKSLVSKVPYIVGKHLAKIPFEFRLGNSYNYYRKLILESEKWSLDQKLEFIISSLNTIKAFAESKLPFYKSLYGDHGLLGLGIKDLSDWEKLPTIDKKQIRHHINSFSGHFKVNTGGTTGEPFSFYIDKNAWAREWAHMHYIWQIKGYNYRQLKITLRGKNIGNKLYHFNPIHNEFVINTYLDFSLRKHSLVVNDLIIKRKIQFIHGYPSAIYNFFLELESSLTRIEIDKIRSKLKVCLFGSEFPVSYMIKYLKQNWGFDYISWYGHSEMCILAFDSTKTNNYHPLITYGFSEICNNELLGTSFHNFDMPLIRYKTGDLIEAEMNGPIIKSFSIKEGRVGDYIQDKFGKMIPLTALIFGRHHKAFDIFDFVQVKQIQPGKAMVYVISKFQKNKDEVSQMFDFSNVEVDFEFQILDKPILSKSGKFKLKV